LIFHSDRGVEFAAERFFIEGYYNARRLHSRNEYRSPNEAEADWRRGKLAA
jgi:transposase InsO family protein